MAFRIWIDPQRRPPRPDRADAHAPPVSHGNLAFPLDGADEVTAKDQRLLAAPAGLPRARPLDRPIRNSAHPDLAADTAAEQAPHCATWHSVGAEQQFDAITLLHQATIPYQPLEASPRVFY